MGKTNYIPTDEEFRAIGFTGMARDFPRDEMAVRMFAAFVGISVEQLPSPAWKFFPNEWTRDAWTRVADAAREFITEQQAK